MKEGHAGPCGYYKANELGWWLVHKDCDYLG